MNRPLKSGQKGYNPHGEKRDQAVELLKQGWKYRQVSRHLGVPYNTIRNWVARYVRT